MTCLADKLLLGVVPEVHGIPVEAPGALAVADLDVVIVLGRTSSSEMAALARSYAPVVLEFNDLFDRVLT